MAQKAAARTQRILRQCISKHMEDAYVAVPDREVWCIHYHACLDKAITDKLATWSCKGCTKVKKQKYLTTAATTWPSCESPSMTMISPALLD